MVRPSEENEWDTKVESKQDDASASFSDLAQQEESDDQAQGARKRAMSVASTHPSVETVVSKAKRAASSLWTLLHAQHCPIAEGCIHPGCRDAKMLHLHFKMCPAGMSFPCPTNHRGCVQGRKLLAHYKRCKSIRAKQLGQSHLRRDLTQQQLCLVCNLVARQARSILERGRPSSCISTPSSSSGSASSTVRKTSSRRIISSFMLDSSNQVVEIPTQSLMPPPKMMPPPPPRAKAPPSQESSLQSHRGFQSSQRAGAISGGCPGNQTQGGTRVVSFEGSSRGRAYSHSEGHHTSPQFQRPRSQSVGAALAQEAYSHVGCATIDEECEGESFAKPGPWNGDS